MMKRLNGIFYIIPLMLLLQSCASMYIRKGNEAYESLKFNEAIGLLEKGLKKTEDYSARRNLADAYFRLSRFKEAASHYELGLLDPKATDQDRINYGKSLIAIGETEKAASIFSGLISRTQNDLGLHSLRQAAFTQDKIKRDSARYEMKLQKIPGVVNISSPIPYKEGFVLTAQTTSGRKDPYNGLSYNDLVYSEFDGSKWSKPKALPKINGPYHDAYGSISPDGNTFIFTRSNTSGKRLNKDEKCNCNTQLFISEKVAGGEWGTPILLGFNKEQYMFAHPAFAPDGKSFIFASNMPGTFGGMDLWESRKTETGWGNPVNLGSAVNTSGEDVFPYFKHQDTLIFSSNGRLTLGGLDVNMTTRKEGGSWSNPKHFGYPFNSHADDFGVHFTTSKTGYLSSNRDGNDAIYSFVISSSLYTLEGLVVDKTTMKPIPNAKIIIQNLTDGSEELDYTDEKGNFTYEFEEGNKYRIVIDDPAYFRLSKEFDIRPTTSREELKAVFELEPLIISKIDDSGTGKDGKGTEGSDTGKDAKSDKDGKTGDGKSDKGKGASTSGEFPYAIPRIYWDYNDASIRSDAKPYLDDLVKLFKDNPNLRVEIRSHCDSRGSHPFNDKLSQQRADAIVEYLKKGGVNTSRFTSKGMGKRKLLNRCSDGVNCSEEEHQENRRSEFLILSKD
jgi:outer membrane protein OmpA-like peptidoglycan-associated protein/tetratricopeptide (TPR) repeat protein